MDPKDQEKTSFVTAQGTYCYRVMSFELKNAGATYQRLVNLMFQKQISITMDRGVTEPSIRQARLGSVLKE